VEKLVELKTLFRIALGEDRSVGSRKLRRGSQITE